jgi:hypothetical protein
VHQGIIDSVGTRISQHIAGNGDRSPLDMRYELLEKGKGWSMIREIGPQGKMGAISDGAAALIQVRDRDPEHVHVSFWRQSEYVQIDFPGIITDLQTLELARRKQKGLVSKSAKSLEANWGGGSTTFGSPRIVGTVLELNEIAEVADAHALNS